MRVRVCVGVRDKDWLFVPVADCVPERVDVNVCVRETLCDRVSA